MLELDPKTTALVLVDLQNGIVNLPLAPRSGAEVVAAAQPVLARFREAGSQVIWVRVGWRADFADYPPGKVDRPFPRPEGGMPAGWSELVEGMQQAGEHCVQKRNWGAFHGTELDVLLRRSGVLTVVLCGIATTLGVESSARQAWELGYDVVVLEDVCSSLLPELHQQSIQHVLPRIARVVVSADLHFQVGQG